MIVSNELYNEYLEKYKYLIKSRLNKITGNKKFSKEECMSMIYSALLKSIVAWETKKEKLSGLFKFSSIFVKNINYEYIESVRKSYKAKKYVTNSYADKKIQFNNQLDGEDFIEKFKEYIKSNYGKNHVDIFQMLIEEREVTEISKKLNFSRQYVYKIKSQIIKDFFSQYHAQKQAD